MRNVIQFRRSVRVLLPAVLAMLAGPALAQPALFVLTTAGQVARTTEGAPLQAATTATPVTNLLAGDVLVGIDVRPLNGRLYGLGFNSTTGNATLYHLTYGATATRADAVGGPVDFDAAIAGPDFGFDFNPAVDRVRVVTSANQNFRINPNTGLAVDTDANAGNGIQMDGAINGATSIVGTAYANSQINTTVTTQYTLSSATDSLFIQNPPNNGTQTAPVAITLGGLPLDFGAEAGFDIPPGVNAPASNMPATGSALAALSVAGVSGLYRIDLQTGAATLSGTFGATAVRDIALGIVTGTALALDNNGPQPQLLRFRPELAGTVTTVPIANITAGELLVGIDGRPATGQLFGLGVNGATDTGTLYLIDPQNGAATVVGAAASQVSLTSNATAVDFDATSWGFDFNPAVDRIRVINSNGANFRINQLTGLAVDADANGANGTTPDGTVAGAAINGAAYSNSFSPTTATTLYTLDAANNRLSIQEPANSGVQTAGRPITIGGFPLDFTGDAGFDIPQGVNAPATGQEAPGTGYATLTVGGGTLLYGIDLPSGAVSQFLGTIGIGGVGLEGLVVWTAQPTRIFANGFED